MSLQFPANPSLNQTTTTGGKTWTFNGSGWASGQPPATSLEAISSNVIPSSDVIYDLGSGSKRWRDLFLSGNTIDLGGTAIKTTANGITFTSASNAAVGVPITVSSIQLSTGGNVITLRAGVSGLQTTTGNTVVPFGGASVTVANAIPLSTTEGSLWLDSDTGDLRVYFGGDWAGVGFGPMGATGAQGPAGLTGAAGLQGNIGPVGATGIQGNIGATGIQGATGPSGAGTSTGKIIAMSIVFGG